VQTGDLPPETALIPITRGKEAIISRLQDRFEFARQVARQAGELALGYFRNFSALTVQSKGVQDMASEADLATENLIRQAVEQRFPEDAFLGEETSESFRVDAGKGTWIVDPIDGTQPFINGIPSWCVAIAYVEDHFIRLGVVYDPTHDELYAALEGHGATLNGKAIHVARATDLSEGLVCVGFSNRVPPEAVLEPLTRMLHRKGMYHRNGSGALSLAYVAAGRLVGYFEPHMNSWDFAAGALLVREAGGRTNDCLPDAQAIIDGGLMLAGAPGIYEQLERVVSG
jgi:myo-inositol-1(or 4)-monophosphatase